MKKRGGEGMAEWGRGMSQAREHTFTHTLTHTHTPTHTLTPPHTPPHTHIHIWKAIEPEPNVSNLVRC